MHFHFGPIYSFNFLLQSCLAYCGITLKLEKIAVAEI